MKLFIHNKFPFELFFYIILYEIKKFPFFQIFIIQSLLYFTGVSIHLPVWYIYKFLNLHLFQPTLTIPKNNMLSYVYAFFGFIFRIIGLVVDHLIEGVYTKKIIFNRMFKFCYWPQFALSTKKCWCQFPVHGKLYPNSQTQFIIESLVFP